MAEAPGATARRGPGTIRLERRAEIGKAKRERTRRSLLDVALRLLEEMDFDAVSVDRLVLAAGVARGTFYNYFDSRDDLLRELGRGLADGFEDEVTALTQGVADPLERIAIRLRRTFKQALACPTYGWLLVRLLPIGPVGTRARQNLEADIRAAQVTGAVGPGSVQVAVDIMQGSLIMAVRNALREDGRYPLEDLVRAVLAGMGGQ